MDKFDIEILNVLQEDGSTSYVALGARVGLSPSACHKRVRDLRDSGIIARDVVLVDEEKAGLDTSVYVQVTLANQQQSTLDRFEKAVAVHKEVMECYLMAGLSDYLLRVLCRDANDYQRLHTQILTQLPGVERVVSNFAIRKVLRRTAAPL